MAILGDIIEIHHRRQHPRLGGLDDSQAVRAVTDLLANCERSIDRLTREIDGGDYLAPSASSRSVPSIHDLTNGSIAMNPTPPLARTAPSHATRGGSRLKLATAYSTLILHVLHVLLHGKWDAISMLDDDDDWITSPRFNSCATHSIAASEAVSSILQSDPELTFMPYLFGIYLLHGSFILLLFADRMPQLGPNQSVEQACETIIRAHEVCVVTLSTEFQVSPSSLLSLATPCLIHHDCCKIHILTYLAWLIEKLPQSPSLHALQCAWLEPDRMGGAQSKAEGTVSLPMDQGRQGARLMMEDFRRSLELGMVLLARGIGGKTERCKGISVDDRSSRLDVYQFSNTHTRTYCGAWAGGIHVVDSGLTYL